MGRRADIPEPARLPPTRAEARALGSRYYFTGEPCCNGHVTARVTSEKKCIECRRAASARKYRRNPEPTRRAAKRRYDRLMATDPESLKESQRKSREKRRDAVRAAGRKHSKKWKQANQPKVRQQERRRRALKLGAEGQHTPDDVKRIREMQRDRCACCRVPLRRKGQIDHITPLAAGGSNWPNNLQLLCRTCNTSKRASDPIDFMQSRGLLL